MGVRAGVNLKCGGFYETRKHGMAEKHCDEIK